MFTQIFGERNTPSGEKYRKTIGIKIMKIMESTKCNIKYKTQKY